MAAYGEVLMATVIKMCGAGGEGLARPRIQTSQLGLGRMCFATIAFVRGFRLISLVISALQ